MVRFTKPALCVDDQISLLVGRGMAGERASIRRRLSCVSYYRLSAYWRPFRESGTERFIAGTNIDEVWDRYLFDRRLRLLTLDAIERVEIAFRTRLAYELAMSGGPFGYTKETSFAPEKRQKHGRLLRKIRNELKRSHETFVEHFKETYGDHHADAPVWMAVEVLSLGCVVRIYEYAEHSVRRRMADFFGVPALVLESWMRCLNAVRNICAHHGRLWNRVLGVKPMIPRQNKFPQWHKPVLIGQDRIFAPLTILAYLMSQVAPNSKWACRVRELLARHPGVPLDRMGFPADWQASEIWKPLLP